MNDQPATGNIAKGVRLFNEHHFWHAHEAWEALWLTASGEEKTFLHGLIQLAAAYHHVQRGTVRGGVRLFDAAFGKLQRFPDHAGGVGREEAIAVAREHRERIARGDNIAASEFPKLSYNGDLSRSAQRNATAEGTNAGNGSTGQGAAGRSAG